jgi:hypothetical protein
MKKKNLSDLEKARSHLIRATTELIIGTGFAIKGVKNLLKEREGRKLVYNVAEQSIRKGFNLMTNLADILKSLIERKSPKSKRGKIRRKIKIE